jgi:hypothetical protein
MPGMHNQHRKLSSIVSYPERGDGGSNKYRGNCSPELIKDLIGHFNVHEICDYMCGSGTTADAAADMGIASHTYDLHSGFDLLNRDIPERPEYIFWHPPYHNIITYSDAVYSAAEVQSRYGYDPRKTDLSRIPDWDGFVEAMNYCMMKQFCALEKGGRMAVLVGDIKKHGRLYSMIFELTKPGTLENVIIKTQHNCFSDNTRYSGRFIPIVHEYLLLLRKDEPLLYSALLTFRRKSDIRDMPGAIWRDIVADAMEDFCGAVALERIYSKLENYKRTREQRHWRDKVRQTLQMYPAVFSSPARGVWTLKKHIT